MVDERDGWWLFNTSSSGRAQISEQHDGAPTKCKNVPFSAPNKLNDEDRESLAFSDVETAGADAEFSASIIEDVAHARSLGGGQVHTEIVDQHDGPLPTQRFLVRQSLIWARSHRSSMWERALRYKEQIGISPEFVDQRNCARPHAAGSFFEVS